MIRTVGDCGGFRYSCWLCFVTRSPVEHILADLDCAVSVADILMVEVNHWASNPGEEVLLGMQTPSSRKVEYRGFLL